MSNQSFPPKPDRPRANHLQSESIPFSIGSASQLAQFSAAAAANYYPKPQGTLGSFTKTPNTPATTTSQPVTPAPTPTPTSTTTTTTTTPSVATPQPISEFHAAALQAAQPSSSGLQPPLAQPIDLSTFKGLKFITLDGCQLETREIYDLVSGTFQWEMCESQDDRCKTFIIDQCANKRVFLITSGSLGRNVVPAIHNLPQVYCIYVYCADVPYNQEWASKFTKVRVVCNDDDKHLLPQLAVDVAQANIEWGDALFKDGKPDKAKEKYEKALKNLTEYTKRADPVMVDKVRGKIAECK